MLIGVLSSLLFPNWGFRHIRLTDFGLAKRLRPGEKTRTVCGTYEYMVRRGCVCCGGVCSVTVCCGCVCGVLWLCVLCAATVCAVVVVCVCAVAVCAVAVCAVAGCACCDRVRSGNSVRHVRV